MEDVEDTIESQEKYVMRSDVFNLFELVNHEQLRQNSQRLKPDTERPCEIHRIKRLMNDNSQHQSNSIQIIMREGVGLLIVAEVEGFSFAHEVHGVGGQADEDDFHDEEVEASPDEDQIEVTGQEHD